ncbi:MAG: DUF4091 domain-containing protein [Eubacteriales bacterium]
MNNASLKLVSSQLKLLPSASEREIYVYEISRASAMRNEPYSFQILYRSQPGVLCQPVSIAVDTSGIPASEWRVDWVPVMNAANDFHERGYVSDLPGLYPDLLMPRPILPEIINKGGMNYEKNAVNLLNSTGEKDQAVWVTLNPDSETLDAGIYSIGVKLTNLADLSVLGEVTLEFVVIDALLPEQSEYYTNWFHVDSLCETHGVEPYSDVFYEIFRSYIRNAVRHRMNTLLLPAFTPMLDTPRGWERRNVQLVDVRRGGEGWEFGFDRLRRFIREADACGIRVFEHCHLFSQWGAENTPNIYDTDGKMLFGWKTDAASDEYREFIRAYLTAFLGFASGEGLTPDRILFHISDEPSEKHLESYKRAFDTVSDLLSDYNMIDALSDVSFWKTGLVKQPVAFIEKSDSFEAQCPSFWLYYTCGTYARNNSNRLISNTAARTRVLGLQMYRYRAAGFLHWGYNYYFDRMSEGYFDPRSNPCGYKRGPGIPYIVYPCGKGAVPSIREKLMCEAFDDLRALKLLESLIGREAVLEFCEKRLGAKINSTLIPEGNELYALREEINQKIKEKSVSCACK